MERFKEFSFSQLLMFRSSSRSLPKNWLSHASNRATTSVSQNKSRIEKIIKLRRLYFMGHGLDGFGVGA